MCYTALVIIKPLIKKNFCRRMIVKILFFVFLILNLSVQKSHASYLDPGTGSYFFQMAIAACLGGLYSIKLYWNTIRGFLENLLHWKITK